MDLNPRLISGSKFCGVVLLCLAAQLACRRVPPAVLQQDVDQALAAAAQAEQPVLLMYAAPWCAACKALGELLVSPSMAGPLRSVVVVRVELQDDMQPRQPLPPALTPQHLGITAVPTLVYLKHNSCLVPEPGAIVQGYIGGARLTEWLRSRP